MKRLFFVLLATGLATYSIAQPPARRQAAAQKAQEQKAGSRNTLSERAQREYPTAAEMPSDVVWRRDVYRSLDLTKDANATLYYPVEPTDDKESLFTYLFKLILRGQISAYDYTLDGNENFSEKNKVKVKELMDRYHILYESKDGRIRVNDSDIPSSEVRGYYIKESSYFDQRTTTYHVKVTALCPLMKRSDEWGESVQTYPLFWVKYDEVSPFLAKLSLMGSNLNNAATLSAEDYFALNRYEGKIYKTTNLQGKLLADYCRSDSSMTKEQKRIEKEFTDFERHIWGKDSVPKPLVSDSLVLDSTKKEKKATTSRRRNSSRRSSSSTTKKVSKPKNNSSSASPRISVRRQRH
ncbi:MAG: gliding motility protein GldN [Bacteroidaceae bacterium]